MAHVAQLADLRLVGHLEALDNRRERSGDRVDDDPVLGALLGRRQQCRFGPAVGRRSPVRARGSGERLRGDL